MLFERCVWMIVCVIVGGLWVFVFVLMAGASA